MKPTRINGINLFGTKEIIKKLNISLNTFYRQFRKGVFAEYIDKDASTGWFYISTPERIEALKVKLER